MISVRGYSVKDIFALMWIDENTVPSLFAYGKHDRVQPYKGSVRLSSIIANLLKAGYMRTDFEYADFFVFFIKIFIDN